MPKKLSCADCARPMVAGGGSLPQGKALCHPCRAVRRSANRLVITCSKCCKPMWKAKGSLPEGQARCQPCRRVAREARAAAKAERAAAAVRCSKCDRALRRRSNRTEPAVCKQCRVCIECGSQCGGTRCLRCIQRACAEREAARLIEARERSVQTAMNDLFGSLSRMVRTVRPEQIPRGLFLVLEAAAHDLGPWAFLDNDATPRRRVLREMSEAIRASHPEVSRASAASTPGVGS